MIDVLHMDRIGSLVTQLQDAKMVASRAKAALDIAEEKVADMTLRLKIAKIPVTWENIFNTSFTNFVDYTRAKDIALAYGYPFISWNGKVYDLNSGNFIIQVNEIPTGVQK